MTTTKVFGGPGTGKTRFLHGVVERLISEGVQTSDICFCSYTNSAVNELCERVGIKRRSKKAPYWTTLHGICLSLSQCDDEFRERTKNTYKKRGFVESWKFAFCNELGIEYEYAEVGASDLLGNKAFTIYTACVGEFYPKLQDIERVIDLIVNHFEEYGWIIEEWHRFKQRNNVIDFEDMLIYAYDLEAVPPVTRAIFDEIQDFNRLEFEIAKRIINNCEESYCAGDDDQAINTWKGARAEFFLNLEADDVVILNKTYRLPPTLWNFAKMILKHIDSRQPKEIEPVEDKKGSVQFLGIRTIEEVTHIAVRFSELYFNKTVFLLFRTNRMVKEAEKVLIRLRKPFRRLKGASLWERPHPRMECHS